MSLFDIHSPHCEAPTGRIGTVTTRCDHGAIIRDASICGATKPCPVHGGEFPTEDDVPIEIRRELLKAATDKAISYYWLCAVYRAGLALAPPPAERAPEWRSIESAPKDGTWILLSGGAIRYGWDGGAPPHCVAGQWTHHLNGRELDEGRWQFAWYDGGYYGEYENPALWQPLPVPPSSTPRQGDQ